MAGRTVNKWFKFQLSDSGDTIRDIAISTINGVGLDHPDEDVSALQDAVRNALPGQPDLIIDITGPFSTTAAGAASGSGAAPVLSGSHTVLEPLNGLMTPLSFGIYFGIQRYWTTGDPVFGLIGSSTDGVLLLSYLVNQDMTYSARLRMSPASAVPAWGTSAIT